MGPRTHGWRLAGNPGAQLVGWGWGRHRLSWEVGPLAEGVGGAPGVCRHWVLGGRWELQEGRRLESAL